MSQNKARRWKREQEPELEAERRGSECSGRFFVHRIHFLCRCHDSGDNARNRKVEIAQEKACHAVREHELAGTQPLGKHADQTVATAEHDDHEADHHTGK